MKRSDTIMAINLALRDASQHASGGKMRYGQAFWCGLPTELQKRLTESPDDDPYHDDDVVPLAIEYLLMESSD